MKKIGTIIIMLMCTVNALKAQGIGEWFNQKKTQKQYLLQQIAALKVYTEYLQKGYSIAHDGLNTIQDFKKGEFNLHTDYFNSLKRVNPNVKNYGKVEETIQLQTRILKVSRISRVLVNSSRILGQEEKDYINRVYERLLTGCGEILDELKAVISNNELQMKDDERLKRIDMLYQQMVGNFTFCRSFGDETSLLISNREREQKEIKDARLMNGIKN